MRDRTEQRVKSWESRPFSDGFAGLRTLADGGFSGVVIASDSWLFMLNGRVVGVVGGDVDDFEDASGTVYEAPDPALPLLFSMQERGGQTQAKYYTNDTALAEADETLSDANFTGFVELSENVLSGDYYLVYYGGRALPVAFVGTSDELKTGDEAFELAADEVGVYEVVKVPVSVTEIPGGSEESEADAAEDAAAATAVSEAEEPSGDEPAGAAAADAGETEPEVETDAEAEDATGGDAGVDAEAAEPPEAEAEAEPDAGTRPDAGSARTEPGESAREPDGDASVESEDGERGDRAARGAAADAERSSESADAPASSSGSADEQSSRPRAGAEASEADAEPSSGDAPDEADESSVFREEEEWRKTKSIPSLSPSEREQREQRKQRERTQKREQPEAQRQATSSRSASQRSRSAEAGNSDARSRRRGGDRSESAEAEGAAAESQAQARAARREAEAADEPSSAAGRERAASASQVDESRVTELESTVQDLRDERDDLQERLQGVREERDDLEARVAELEAALEDADGEPAVGASLGPEEALRETNLFVRYDSKGKPTLEDLAGGDPRKDEINENLRLDYHTQFDLEDATVDGQPFEAFLYDSSPYRFVDWVVRELPYEILDAGHRSGLSDVYEVVPEVDRVELGGTVDVETESGTERREFDVVLRDRMGNALVVAELNDARDPVSGDEMADLVDAAEVVGSAVDELGAAFYVTASFFEPPALEAAADATGGGGLLSRNDKESYVKVARKQGFHLCLAEDRNETFNLTVPEL